MIQQMSRRILFIAEYFWHKSLTKPVELVYQRHQREVSAIIYIEGMATNYILIIAPDILSNHWLSMMEIIRKRKCQFPQIPRRKCKWKKKRL